jgi:hypothetical protein
VKVQKRVSLPSFARVRVMPMAPSCSRMSASRAMVASVVMGVSCGWWVRMTSRTAGIFSSGKAASFRMDGAFSVT